MTGMPSPADPGMPSPAATGTASTGTARKTLTDRRQKPCSPPPKSRPGAYPRRPGAGPGRTRAQRHGDSRRPVRLVLPDEPPTLTPVTARALLRVLLKAHAAQTAAQQATTSGPEGKG
jgi:hypothetical protein